MEKKTTQRIIGVFVLIALAIIVLPLFLSKNNETTSELASSASSSNTSTTTNQPNDNHSAATVSSAEATPSDSQLLNKVSPVPAVAQNADETKQSEPANGLNKSDEHPAANQVSLNETLKTEDNSSEITNKKESNKITDTFDLVSKDQLNKQAIDKKSSKTASKHQVKASKHLAAKAKQTAWVVQMGNFKNKENANRLTTRLKTAGFKAFSHVVKTGGKERVRVYVGPENKQASANQLSNKINSKTKLRGIVVSYKPIAL